MVFCNDKKNDDASKRQAFVSFTLSPGIDISYFSDSDNQGLNISFYLDKNGATISHYPMNNFYNRNTSSNAVYYHNYSQVRDGIKFKILGFVTKGSNCTFNTRLRRNSVLGTQKAFFTFWNW